MSTEFNDLIAAASQAHGVPEALLHGVIRTESNYRADATSPVGARGLMQLMPATAMELGLKVDDTADERTDPAKNVDAGARYLAWLMKRHDSVDDALRAYNRGSAAIQRWRRKGGDEKRLPKETREYSTKVLANRDAFEAGLTEDTINAVNDGAPAVEVQTTEDLIAQLRAEDAADAQRKAESTRLREEMKIEDELDATPPPPERGYVADMGVGLVSGPLRAFEELGQSINGIAGWLDENVLDLPGDPNESALNGLDITPNGLEAQTVPGSLVEGVTQFVTGWVTGGRATKGIKEATTTIGRFFQAAGRGAAVDAAVFDPHEERLSNLVEHFPELSNPVTRYLAADDSDSEAEGRFKNAVEGFGLGTAVEGLMLGLRAIKAGRGAKEVIEIDDAVKAEGVEIEIGLPAAPPATALDGLQQGVDARLKQVGIADHVRGNAVEQIIKPLADGRTVVAKGRYVRSQKLIEVAMRGLRGEYNPTETVKTLNHEIVHALRDLQVFTAEEWDIVVAAARADTEIQAGMKRYASLNLTPEKFDEESVADLFGRWVASKPEDLTPEQATLVQRVIDFFNSIRDTFVEKGYQTAEDVFAAIDRGDFAQRLPDAPASKPNGEAPKAKNGAEEPPQSRDDRYKEIFRLSPDARKRIATAIETGDLSAANELVDFNANRIDWEGIGEGDASDVRALLNTFSDQLEDAIDTVKGGVQTNKQTVRLANLVGISAENVHALYKDVRGERGLTARMLAAERTMVASVRKLKELAVKYNASGSDVDRAAMHRQIEIHAAIQAEVKGSKTEVARALQAMRILKRAEADQFREMNLLLGGDAVKGAAGYDDFVKKLIHSGDLIEINKLVRDSTSRSWMKRLTEIAINGMLSSPKTHLVNMLSNAIKIVMGPTERYLAAAIGNGYKLFKSDADYIAFREANAYFHGTVTAFGEATRFGLRSLKEGQPIRDAAQRIEMDGRRALVWDEKVTGAKALNYLGVGIRWPTRILQAEDEFFKTFAYRASLHSEAARIAMGEAGLKKLTGEKLEKFLAKRTKDLLAKPTDEMHTAATLHARYQTFQEHAPPGSIGESAERFFGRHPLMKLVIAPFLRTPTNLLRQAFLERTPLALASKRFWNTVRQGGPEAHLAISRLSIGTGVLTMAYGWTQSGVLTGADVYNNTESLDGVQPYSIKVGDTWYQYNRVDPLGSVLALMADFASATERYFDAEDPDNVNAFGTYTAAVLFAIGNSVFNKTWMTSLADITDAIESASKGGPDEVDRAMSTLIAGQLGKAVPYAGLSRTVNDAVDPLVRDASTIGERISRGAGIYGDSEGLAAKRDYLGREMRKDTSTAYYLNPLRPSTESTNPVDVELSRLAIDFQPPPRTLDGIKLTSEQYQEWKRLIGQEPHAQFGGRTLEEYYAQLFSSSQYEGMSESDFDAGGKETVVKNIYSAATTIAKAKLIQKYDLLNPLNDRKRRKKKQIAGLN